MLFRLLSAVTAMVASLAPHTLPSAQHVVRTQPVAVVRPAATVAGGDISWPNCARTQGLPGRHGYALPMPVHSARFVVLGLTNGPAFTRNPCLAHQVQWVRARHLWVAAYAVVHYPNRAELRRYGGRGTPAQRVARVGVAEARHALATMRRAGLRTRFVWVDVETVGQHPWASRSSLNRALLFGVLTGYRRAHVRTGIYSYAHAWQRITGGRRLPHVATWVPSGGNQVGGALARCVHRSFSGGPVLLAQWGSHSRDQDLTCPGRVRRLSYVFTRT